MRKPNKLESLERKEICHYLLTSVWKYIVYIYEEEQLGNYICLFAEAPWNPLVTGQYLILYDA